MRDIRITGIVGSPRLKKNTDALVRQALHGCRSEGASVETVYLNKLKIKP
ncbi:MAG: NAD(P)H-dependent oxidoreductase, partial [Desulfobacterales bacterium]